MECLPPTVMNNYITCFRLLTHLGVNNIWATGVHNKNRLRKCTIARDKQLQKKECGHFGQRTSTKKGSATWQWLVWIPTKWCALLLLNFMNLRGLFGVWKKLKEDIFKNNNQINSTVTTRRGFFFSLCWIRAFPSTRVVLQNAWVFYHINKDEVDESLPLIACNFSEIFRGRQIRVGPWRN